ncbi:MAG: ribosome silencing factor [Betaproteobacteria bacterium]|nr:ribosome silencing factor [Betaproteobacteria bacterium]
MSEASAKKDIQKLQRVIVDALEDVKAQDIQVFNTEHLSPLFERVIIASGTSNRQTKALSASVRDKVRDSGFGKPRIEGEDNGEWIIADCGPAVVHIMQPVIRQYYNLEEIWGDKPVRLKFGAPKPAAPAKAVAEKKPVAAKKPGVARAAKPAAKTTAAPAAKKPALKAPAKKTPAKAPAKKVTTKVVGKPAAKPAAKTTAKTPARKAGAPARKLVKPATRKSA